MSKIITMIKVLSNNYLILGFYNLVLYSIVACKKILVIKNKIRFNNHSEKPFVVNNKSILQFMYSKIK